MGNSMGTASAVRRQSLLSRSTCWMWVALAGLLIVGCSGSSAEFERASISGTVTLDGEPLPSGQIVFQPTLKEGELSKKKGVGRPATATIKDGKYEISAAKGPTVGPNKVQITAIRDTGKTTEQDGKKVAVSEQYLPARYNTATLERYEVTSGKNTKNFELKSK